MSTGDVVLVTGSGGGMGLAAAAARRGGVHRDDRRQRPQAGAGRRRNGRAEGGHGRRRPATVQELIASVFEEFRRIDVLVTMVGGISGHVTTGFWDITDHDWDAALRVNVTRISGTVVERTIRNGRPEVVCELVGKNQNDEVTVTGTARIELVARDINVDLTEGAS